MMSKGEAIARLVRPEQPVTEVAEVHRASSGTLGYPHRPDRVSVIEPDLRGCVEDRFLATS